mmetsp:Transcript_28721/g.83263  ORF Transcript_28721/g.83263 Transcript_28721/m.83263 type:complete len:554 (+) Transcript_28721:70-1731(+)
MGLFATLAASAGGSDGSVENDSGKSTSTTSLPTAVQIHTGTSHRIDFLSGAIDGRGPSAANISTTSKRRFETLSYQAVEVTAQQQEREGRGGGGGGILQQQLPGSSKARKHQRPNLGIWDVRLPEASSGGGDGDGDGDGGTDNDKSTNLVNRLLQKVLSSPSSQSATPGVAPTAAPPTVIFALDLADPATVYPAMEAMVAALLRRYDVSTDSSSKMSASASASASATTRLSKLRSTKFGTAPEQSEEAPSKASGGGGGRSADTKIALIICCAVPPTPTEVGPEGGGATVAPQSFQEKQAVSLVHYHLHRFASEVDCTLAFVRPDNDGASVLSGEGGDDGDSATAAAKSKGTIPSMTVSELAGVVSRVASGMTPVEEEEKSNDDDDEADTEEGQEGKDGESAAARAGLEQPPIFAPGTHDDDLIGSVLLRNASCPGVWDAAKDDLWKALPSTKAGGDGGRKASDKKKDGKVGGAAADEAWLTKLAASLPAQGATGAGDDVSVRTSKSSKSSATAGGSSVAKASVKKKKPSKASATKAETKNDDPTSFFESLMKK